MKNKLHLLLIILFGFFTSGILFAQQITPTVISSQGNSNQFSNGQLDWTIGEIAVTTLSVNDLLLTQGFHQPLPAQEIVDDENQILVSISPNPTPNDLTIVIESQVDIDVSYTLYDNRGRLLWRNMDTGQELILHKSLSYLPSATYLLVLDFSSGRTDTYKIQKITN